MWEWRFQLYWGAITIILESSFVCSATVAGPYRIICRRVELCPKELDAEKSLEIYLVGMRDRKNPDLWYYSGNFTTGFEWNDELLADIHIASWSARGGWKDNAHVIKIRKICESQRNYLPFFHRSLMLSMFGDEDRRCPFPPGTYTVRNVTSDLYVKPVPTFFYGKWRADVLLLDATEKCLGCLRVFADTVPRIT